MGDRVNAIRTDLRVNCCAQINLDTTGKPNAFLNTPTTETGANAQTICLSGPIKITVPAEIPEENPKHSKSDALDVKTSSVMDIEDPTVEIIDSDNTEEVVSPLCPYIVGDHIFLKTADAGKRIKAKILEYFPATLSCVMLIRFVDPPIFNNTSECVLKLHDRRFSTQIRSDEGAAPWTPEIENLFQAFVQVDDASEFFSYWDAERATNPYWQGSSVHNRDRWSQAKVEAYLQWESTSAYETEKKAYELMTDLQGVDVPKVLGEVVLDTAGDIQMGKGSDSIMSDRSDINPHISSCPGLLLQHVQGFTLTDLVTNMDREHWQITIDAAIDILHRIQNVGILNRDVKTRSFIVDPLTHKVMMIDFGLVFFRDQVDDDREWQSRQASQDEEGAIGLTMSSMLEEEAGGGYIYRPSELALRLAYRFNDEDGEKEGGTNEEEEYVKNHLGQPWDYYPEDED
ncbi:hypothetical protein KCU98_g2795, partial [Aureobasidium melanogenum]